jgi:hypothetical protein
MVAVGSGWIELSSRIGNLVGRMFSIRLTLCSGSCVTFGISRVIFVALNWYILKFGLWMHRKKE